MATTADLEELSGVGPATAKKLRKNGYESYQAIAVASPGERRKPQPAYERYSS